MTGSTKKLYILAHDARDVATFIHEHDIPIGSIKYVVDDATIRGMSDVAYVLLPSFWQRTDCLNIYRALQQTVRSGKVLPFPVDMDPNAGRNLTPTIPPDKVLVDKVVYDTLNATITTLRESYATLERKLYNALHPPQDRLNVEGLDGDIAPSGIKRIRGAEPLEHKIKKIRNEDEV